MKKLLLLTFIVLSCGCSNKNNNLDLVIGEWSYLKTEIGETEYSNYKFNDDKTFEYSVCYHYSSDDTCSRGEAEWTGTYSIDSNTIKLQISNENQIINRFDSLISDPPTTIVVNLDEMYLCSREEGLNCSKKFFKDTN